jgi:hypothetical protein
MYLVKFGEKKVLYQEEFKNVADTSELSFRTSSKIYYDGEVLYSDVLINGKNVGNFRVGVVRTILLSNGDAYVCIVEE